MLCARYVSTSGPDIADVTGCDGQPGQRRPALSQPAGSRAARPVPPCPLRTILTSNNPPENGKADFLKFLALRYYDNDVTLRSFARLEGWGAWVA